MRSSRLSLIRRSGVAFAAATVVVATPVSLGITPAHAAPGDTHTATFTFTGAPESFTVPAEATALTIEMWGGNGGSTTWGGFEGVGGAGSHVRFTVPVAELGATVEVRVGGNGGDVDADPVDAGTGATGGWNGGGAGGDTQIENGQPGAGGGGATDLRVGGTRIAVAGGGGGAGVHIFHPFGGSHGGAGGSTPSATTADGAAGSNGDLGAAGGGGGTATAVGAGSNPGVGPDGGAGGSSPGAFVHSGGGGGGGGGLFGGGGGFSYSESSGGGGGGGSSSVPAGATAVSFAASALPGGQVTFTWTEADVVPLAPTALQVVAGDGQLTFSWTPPAANGGSAVTGFSVTLTPGGASCTTTTTACTITGLSNDVTYTATVVALNALGAGPPSVSASAAPRAQVPAVDAPQPAPAPPAETLAFTGHGPGFLAAIGLLLIVLGIGMERVRRALSAS